MSNKDKIMDAATELFHLYGYDGTSIDMLIKKAGVSKSNFYYYFEGKEELGLSVLTTFVEKQIREVSEIMQADLNPVEQFLNCYKRAFLSYHSLFKQPIYPGSFVGNLTLEQSSINEKFRSVLDEYYQQCEALVESCLLRGIEEGFFHEDLNPKELARYFVSQFEGAVLLTKARKSLSPIKDVVIQGKKLLLKDEWTHLADEWMALLDES